MKNLALILVLEFLFIPTYAFDAGQREYSFYQQEFEYASDQIKLSDFEKYDSVFDIKVAGEYPDTFVWGGEDNFLDSYQNTVCRTYVSTRQNVERPVNLFTAEAQMKVLSNFGVNYENNSVNHSFVFPRIRRIGKFGVEYIKNKLSDRRIAPESFFQSEKMIEFNKKYFHGSSDNSEGEESYAFKKNGDKILFRYTYDGKNRHLNGSVGYGYCEKESRYFCSLSSYKQLNWFEELESKRFKIIQNEGKTALNAIIVAKNKKQTIEGLRQYLSKKICRIQLNNISDSYTPAYKKACRNETNKFINSLNGSQLACGPKIQDLNVSKRYSYYIDGSGFWAQKGKVIVETRAYDGPMHKVVTIEDWFKQ